MIAHTPFIIVDLETTGLEPRLDKIIEIAAVKVVNGEIVEEWSTLVNPGIFIPHETTSITGITTEMVSNAPQFDEILEEYLNFMEGGIFVAHNADFDRAFIDTHLLRSELTELKAMPHPYLCTFKLAKRVHPNLSKYSLGALAQLFEIELPQAHRALHDARATAELFNKFMKTLQNGGLKHVKDIPVIQNLPKETEGPAEGQASLF